MACDCCLECSWQKIADIDLTQPPPSVRLHQAGIVPKECGAPEYVNSDGAIVSSKGRFQLIPQLMILNGKTFRLGDRVKGEVLMRNIGPDAVEIPWTVDPQISIPRVGSLQHDYDLGRFEVEIKNQHAAGIRLESESVSSFLYSSPSPGTSLRLEPGQWIVARFDFILEADYKSSVGRHLRSGKADIVLRWRQALDTWRRESCKIETGYYNYDYGAEAKPVFLSFGNVPSR